MVLAAPVYEASDLGDVLQYGRAVQAHMHEAIIY